MKSLIVTIISLIAFTFPTWANIDSQTDLFQKANAAYDSGEYAHAIELYNSIIDNGYDCWELRYNMGNAYYRQDNIGYSILNYERALRMAPSKKNIKDNLALARSRTADNIEELPRLFLIEWAQDVAHIMTLRGWLTLVIILAIISCAAASFFFIAKDYKTRKTIFIIGSVFLFLLIVSAVNATISSHNATKENEAIITSPLVVVKGSPDAKSVDKFVIHEGTKIIIGDVQDEWWQIEIADGKSGWINGGAEII